jgi:hypothetical protein
VKGDSVSPQFWVDAERWRVLRVIQREPWNANRLADIRFGDYTELLDVPVPRQILTFRDGRLVHRQQIVDVKTNPKLSSSAFNLSRWIPVG